MANQRKKTKSSNGSSPGFEATLWATAEQAMPAPNFCGFSLSASNGDLSCLGSNERNSPKAKAQCGPSERAGASHWAGVRWRNLTPSAGNANYAWVQHFKLRTAKCELRIPRGFNSTIEIRHSEFAPSSNQSGEGEIRKAIIEADLMDCMVALSRQTAYSMKITEDVSKYATVQGIAEEEALKKGMEEKCREFTEKGSELYAKA